MPIGFYLCVTNIVIMIVNNYFLVWIANII
jgi:hypothetical protein